MLGTAGTGVSELAKVGPAQKVMEPAISTSPAATVVTRNLSRMEFLLEERLVLPPGRSLGSSAADCSRAGRPSSLTDVKYDVNALR